MSEEAPTVEIHSWQELIVHLLRPYSDKLDEWVGITDGDARRLHSGPRDTDDPNEPHPGYVTVKDIRRIYGASASYIYKLANTKHWRRYTSDGKVRYHRKDVDDTLGKG